MATSKAAALAWLGLAVPAVTGIQVISAGFLGKRKSVSADAVVNMGDATDVNSTLACARLCLASRPNCNAFRRYGGQCHLLGMDVDYDDQAQAYFQAPEVYQGVLAMKEHRGTVALVIGGRNCLSLNCYRREAILLTSDGLTCAIDDFPALPDNVGSYDAPSVLYAGRYLHVLAGKGVPGSNDGQCGHVVMDLAIQPWTWQVRKQIPRDPCKRVSAGTVLLGDVFIVAGGTDGKM